MAVFYSNDDLFSVALNHSVGIALAEAGLLERHFSNSSVAILANCIQVTDAKAIH